MNHFNKPPQTEGFATAIAKLRADWLDKWTKKLVPPDLYAKAAHLTGGDRKAIRRWFIDNKIELREHPDRTEIARDGTVLGQLVIVFDGGTVQAHAKEFPQPPPEPPETVN